ncbi:MAG: flavodoxin domain-containing protein [Oscillospiraceae bacterium]|nr:flavodoxin domain-containing protein [Oscillospiraceae bacterium]
MKTLILYATKYGATREIAERIATQIGNATLHDLKQIDLPPLADFDCILIGSSLYAGSIRKEVKTFLAQHGPELQGKKTGLFLSGMSAEVSLKPFEDNFPTALLEQSATWAFLGGVFDPQKANFAERLIMKAITKQSGYVSTISDEKIEQFTAQMKA